ncbi:Dolichyl-phosphate-mannose-protein mannosyltransferase, putative [Trichomonas vaginalis G3]|uniref:Dolichyl-phosphate-mannose-protein mannosyltransferase, putative n=1 Tax=Trichomonas vaginalis (strain ATCC PRA-98 / G3) TaxID=412133 RepID=A2EI00_TRIV3|nr:dolichyl-phosphate-mannose-protein mannosyltransferase protein [Trichomonas vaginalis G3]EAY07732.1 Dolichyl-phosphate-mannose-protein mannosyltransferase, putative [Trichomonas vaginalis G3]KAI5552575.1 dolichyl-phosphate-mannose-protein mannosyltransferase protein [Trichomonas vaginalis G3]|eukprot:XP_001319955.1 Dolichyl-phosphate-mannose-protein mannosyltransferase [Trichomonas vaginalis G3]
MSVIHVTNIDSELTEGQVKRYFRHYGGIADMTFRLGKEGKHDGKAKITFYNEYAGLQAFEKNGAMLGNYPIYISISLENQGKGSAERVYKGRLYRISEILVIILTLILSVSLHVYKISEPAYLIGEEPLIFDHLNQYIHHKRPYDDQPPLGKLIYLGWAKLCGYKGTQKYEMQNQEYIPFDNTTNYVFLRSLSCFCGSLVPPIVVAAISLRYHSLTALFLVGFILSLDSGLITISRSMSLDSICLFFSAISIYYTCLLYRRNTWFNGIKSTVFAILACCIRYPAFGLFFFIFFSNWHLGFGHPDSTWNFFSRTAGFIWIGLTILSIVTAIHLIITPKFGDADLQFPEYFRDRELAESVILIIWKQLRYKTGKTYKTLPQSRYIQWAFWRAPPMVIYNMRDTMIAIVNSPAIILSCFITLFWCFLLQKFEFVFAILTSWGFLHFYKAATFMFDAYVPLIISLGGLAMVYDRLPRIFKYTILWLLIPLSVCGFYLFMPITYGLPMDKYRFSLIALWPTFKRTWNV